MTLLTEPARIVLAKNSVAATDTNIREVSLLLHGNGTNGSTTITDSSLTPKTVTAVGNAQISTAQSKFGGSSIAFDGTGDYCTVSTSNVFELDTGNYTWEAWIYLNSLSSVNGLYFYGSNNTNRQQVLILADGAFSHYVEVGASFTNAQSSAGAITASTWFHVAAVRSGNNFLAFVDGQLLATATSTLALPSGQIPNIGFAVTGGVNRFFNGYIDDLRITKGVARYTANFTPPTAPFPDF